MIETPKENFERLRKAAFERGAAVFGAASMLNLKKSELDTPAAELDRFPGAVSFGIRLSEAILDDLVDGPTRQYAYHYKIVNHALDSIGLVLTSMIQNRGYKAYPVPASQIIDWDANTGELSHKWIAYNAGLGWYGRNNLLVHPQYGARVRYATVLTDLPLETGSPLDIGCGDCYNCMEACPVGAIGRSRAEYNLEKCTAQVREFRNKRNLGHYICGLCIKACPGVERVKN